MLVYMAGSSGRAVKLMANYFKLETHTNWCLYQYRVDFAPEEDRTPIRKGLLRNHKAVLGGYIFDGTMMFTSHRLNPDVCGINLLNLLTYTQLRGVVLLF